MEKRGTEKNSNRADTNVFFSRTGRNLLMKVAQKLFSDKVGKQNLCFLSTEKMTAKKLLRNTALIQTQKDKHSFLKLNLSFRIVINGNKQKNVFKV